VKAIRVHKLGDPEVMQLEELPDPEPGSGEVVVYVKAIGVNPVDTYIRAGIHGYHPELPYTPGTDAAGVVKAIGEGVRKVAVGRRVYIAGSVSGTYAEQALCKESQVYPLPERLSFAQGAAVGVPYATAWQALFRRARAEPGEWVLIHGASGGVGIAAVQLALASGMSVIGTASTAQGRQLVADQGVAHVLDHQDPDHFTKLFALTDGHGVDVIVEMLANINLGKDLTVLAHGGRVVVVGSRGTVEINPRDTMSREAHILGMSLMNATDRDRFQIHAALAAGLANGTLRPVIQAEIPLSEAARAHREVIERGSSGKIVLVP
jgi:NADPH:quinone reductase